MLKSFDGRLPLERFSHKKRPSRCRAAFSFARHSLRASSFRWQAERLQAGFTAAQEQLLTFVHLTATFADFPRLQLGATLSLAEAPVRSIGNFVRSELRSRTRRLALRKELTQVLKAAAVCLLAGFACAQETAQPPSTAEEDKATIVQLVRQVRQLEEKVAALEGKPSAAPAPTTPLETPANNSESTDNGAAQMSAFQESHDLRGIHWRGFGEVDYKVLDQRQPELSTLGFVPGSAGNFYTGDFDLFLTSKLTEKASVLAEIVIGERDAQSFNIELARALLNYDYNDHLRLSLGRYHTSIGYYNTAFHSGRYLQTAVDRPLVMAFATNGGLLPTQAIGLSVTGQIPSGRLGDRKSVV